MQEVYYLVALSYEAGELDFGKGVTLNQIYKDLLHRVYKREWAEIQHPTLKSKDVQITEEQFIQAMAEIAVACWHGNGRTTTVAEIEKHCQHSGIGSVLEVFKKSGSKGVTQLLTAFYFRQQGVQGTDKTFEFTHKSFREYLTAQRIITEIETIEEKLERHRSNSGQGWTEQECLRRWAVLCGAEAMDSYLFDWLLGEIQLRSEKAAEWQQLFCDLISYMLRQGMPMEKLDGLTFLQMSQQSRNAEEALLVVLNAFARVTKIISKIKWEESESFGEWLSKLQGQRIDGSKPFVFDCLSYLNLADCNLVFKDLYWANLKGADLQGAYLYEANLKGVDLQGADLQGADLEGADLYKAYLERANLEGANLEGANLEGAYLERANLEGANLEEANLEGANLEGANLAGTNLQRADLEEANLEGANLEGTNLQGADLEGVNLCGTNLYAADLQGANLQRAKLRKSDLKGVNTDPVDLSQVIWVDNDGKPL